MINKAKCLILLLFMFFAQMPSFAGICDVKLPGNYTKEELANSGHWVDDSYNTKLHQRLEAAYDKKYHHQIDKLHGEYNAPLDAHQKEVTNAYYDNESHNIDKSDPHHWVVLPPVNTIRN